MGGSFVCKFVGMLYCVVLNCVGIHFICEIKSQQLCGVMIVNANNMMMMMMMFSIKVENKKQKLMPTENFAIGQKNIHIQILQRIISHQPCQPFDYYSKCVNRIVHIGEVVRDCVCVCVAVMN